MADEANFCLNCGENLAKWRTGSGFVKEQSGAEDHAPGRGRVATVEDRPARAKQHRDEPPHGHAPAVAAVVKAQGQSRQVQALISEARAAADSGKLDAAHASFQAALGMDPDSQEAWYGLGVVYGRMGNQLEALGAFNRLIEANPGLAAAHDAKGTALAHLGRLAEAVAAFDEAIRIDPLSASPRLEKGFTLMRSEDAQAARACFEQVLNIEPRNFDALMGRGDALARLNDNAGALHALDEALAVSPLSGSAWRKKGDLLLKMGHAVDARRCLDRAVQIDPSDFEALIRRGDATRQAGDPSGAVDSYEKAASLRPTRADPHVRKGLLYFSLNQFPAARECFAKARELEPDLQVAAVNYAVALYRCREFAAAKAASEAALMRWPGQVDLARVLAAAERKITVGRAAGEVRPAQPPGAEHTVEDMFLIYRDGRLIAHQTRRLRADMDNQLLSGMLTAIQSFIQEAFREGDEGELNEMAFGRNQILIERGRLVSLAVVIRGVPPVGARAELSFAVENIEQKFRTKLEEWDGEASSLRGISDTVRRVLEVL